MQRNRNSRRRRRGVRFFGRRISLQRLIPFALFLVLFAVSAAMLIGYGVRSVDRKSDNAQLAAEYEAAFVAAETPAPTVRETPEPTAEITPEPTLSPVYHDFSGETPAKARSLHSQNSDLVGWLYIKGVVSLPVVQRDNEFYLNHDFSGKESDGGALFLDQYHSMAEETQHFLVHGHNMYDSSMFGIVSTYYKADMVKKHGFATFSTLHAPEDYVIYAVLRLPEDPANANYLPYVGTANFSSEAAFYSFTDTLKERSLFDIPIDVQPSDALLSLSTCIDDDRLLVCFRRLREGETKDGLQLLLDRAAKK